MPLLLLVRLSRGRVKPSGLQQPTQPSSLAMEALPPPLHSFTFHDEDVALLHTTMALISTLTHMLIMMALIGVCGAVT